MDSIQFLKNKVHLPDWFYYKAPVTPPGFCCIGFSADGFSLARVRRRAGQVELRQCEFYPCDPKDLLPTLAAAVKQHYMKGVQCSWMLRTEEYRLLSMEDLPVLPEEFQAAIRWKIKGSLPFPIEDAIIDSFPIPAFTMHHAKKTRMVVVSQASYLQPIVEQINQSGLQLTTIDIPELGYRNIMAFYEQDEMGIALIHLKEQASEIVIGRQKTFYFSRHIEWGLDLLAENSQNQEQVNQYLDRLALEIQRSFDYYQSQWRYSALTKIVLAFSKATDIEITDYLSQRLAMPVQNLDINQIMPHKRELDRFEQGQYLLIIGGALRREVVKDKEKNTEIDNDAAN